MTLSKFVAYINEGWIEYTPEYLRPIALRINEKPWERKAYHLKTTLPNSSKARLAHFLDLKGWKI